MRRDDAVEAAYPAIDRYPEYKHRDIVAQWTALMAADTSFTSRPVAYAARCQALRSITRWSGGRDTEASIGAAYISLIEQAQHCIYIENQYFISSRISASKSGDVNGVMLTTGRQDDRTPSNLVARALYERISRAIAAQQTFRVVVVVPVRCGGG